MCYVQISDFWNFDFIFSKISDIGLLWSKITIFIIEITLKQLLLTKYGWNNPNWGRLGLKKSKTSLFGILAAQNSSHTQTFKYMSRAQFSSELDFFFLMLVAMSSITIDNNWNYQKSYLKVSDPRIVTKKFYILKKKIRINILYFNIFFYF